MNYLTELLKEEHRQAGLYLEEDDHILYLKKGQETIARFSATVARIDLIHAVADAYLEQIQKEG